MPGTLLELEFHGARPFLAGGGPRVSTAGVALREGTSPRSVELAATSRIKVGRDPALDALDQFTIDLRVAPARRRVHAYVRAGFTRNIAACESS